MQLPESNEHIFLDQMARISEAESEAQGKVLGMQDGCHIKTTKEEKTVVVEAWPRGEDTMQSIFGRSDSGHSELFKAETGICEDTGSVSGQQAGPDI